MTQELCDRFSLEVSANCREDKAGGLELLTKDNEIATTQNAIYRNLNEEQLSRSLQSVGMECFVKYYDLFADPSIEPVGIAEVLVRDENYAESACRTRISNARRIIEAGQSSDVFRLIIDSKASDFAKAKAGELLRQIS